MSKSVCLGDVTPYLAQMQSFNKELKELLPSSTFSFDFDRSNNLGYLIYDEAYSVGAIKIASVYLEPESGGLFLNNVLDGDSIYLGDFSDITNKALVGLSSGKTAIITFKATGKIKCLTDIFQVNRPRTILSFYMRKRVGDIVSIDKSLEKLMNVIQDLSVLLKDLSLLKGEAGYENYKDGLSLCYNLGVLIEAPEEKSKSNKDNKLWVRSTVGSNLHSTTEIKARNIRELMFSENRARGEVVLYESRDINSYSFSIQLNGREKNAAVQSLKSVSEMPDELKEYNDEPSLGLIKKFYLNAVKGKSLLEEVIK